VNASDRMTAVVVEVCHGRSVPQSRSQCAVAAMRRGYSAPWPQCVAVAVTVHRGRSASQLRSQCTTVVVAVHRGRGRSAVAVAVHRAIITVVCFV
jgi:hypothetical protein